MEFYAKVVDKRGEGSVYAIPGRFDHESGKYICRLVPEGTVNGEMVYQVRDNNDNIFAIALIRDGQFVVS